MNIPGFKGEIRADEPMSKHTSYAIGGRVDMLALPADRGDLLLLLRTLRERKLPFFVLGGGTNLLVRDGGFRGVAVSLGRMRAFAVEREYRSVGGQYAVLSAEAGAPLAGLLAFAAERGLTGLEFAAGIPGTVGGAVCMNAGTADGEMGDVVDAVTMIGPDGGVETVDRERMGFGYRTANVPDGRVIVAATVVLRQDERERVQERIRTLLLKRKERQPGGFPNAGSVFKNPLDESAGRLIEAAGLKGRRVGGAQVSEKHANFIVNVGRAKAADVLKLMEIVRKTVLEQHGVPLEPEIRIIGED